MNLREIIEISERVNFVKKNRTIRVPRFKFNGVTCKNVDFVFMGFSESAENLGKAIYMSLECLPNIKVTMNSLLAGSINGDVGTGTIGTEAANSLDSAIFKITKRHLLPYTRTYDGHTSIEKVFFPLECEVFGENRYSEDEATLDKYPQWAWFKRYKDSIIKHLDYKRAKHKPCWWWEANKSWFEPCNFCNIDDIGCPNDYNSSHDNSGCVLAFCI